MESSEVVFMCAFIFSVIFGCYYRTIRDKNVKKNLGTCVGLVMTLIVSGAHCLHLIVTVLINAIIILKVDKKYCHVASFTFSFLYLIFFRSTEYFGIPYPPAYTNLTQMTVTLKLIGLALEINSSQVSVKNSQEDIDKHEMTKVEVNCIDIFHYCFNYIGVLVGPYFKYRTFIDYFNYPFAERAQWKRASINKLKYTPVYGMVQLVVTYIWPTSYLTTEEFYQQSWLYRYWYMWPVVTVFEMRLFIRFLLSSAACITAGFGAYPCFTNPKPGLGPSEKFSEMKQLLSNEAKLSPIEYSFETINNVNVYEVKFCTTMRDLVKNWNCCVQYWLAANIYQQFPYKKYRMAVTILVSTVWHGVYIGYYFSLGLLPIIFVIENVYIELYSKDANGWFLKIYKWIHWFYKVHCFTYLIIAFLFLRVDLIFKYYNSIYHIGAIVPAILYIVGLILLKMKMTNEKKIQKALN